MEDKLGVAIGGTALEKGVSEVVDMTQYAEVYAEKSCRSYYKKQNKKANEKSY